MTMSHWLKKLFAPPVFDGDDQKTAAARLLNTLLLILLFGTVAFGASMLILGERLDITEQGLILILVVVILDLLLLMRRGRVGLSGTVLAGALWLSFTVAMFSFGGMHNPVLAGYFVVIMLAGILAGGRTLLAFALLSALAVLGVSYAQQSGWVVPKLAGPTALDDLPLLLILLSATAFMFHYAMTRLARAYEGAREKAATALSSTKELQASREALAAQARESERWADYLEVIRVVAQNAASARDVQALLAGMTDLINERFGFCYTSIYLLDGTGQWAVLQVAAGEGSEKMPAGDHRLRRGEGLVGRAMEQALPQIARDASADASLDSSELPKTRSEAALPLCARDELIGILHVQGTGSEGFHKEVVTVLQTLADQVAMAISNNQLVQQVQDKLAATDQARDGQTHRAWQNLFQARSDLGFLSDPHGTRPAGELWEPQMEAAFQTERATTGVEAGTGAGTVTVPVRIRDQVIGVVDGRKPEGQGDWTTEEIELLITLTKQLEVALESAQLYEETQRRAVREQIVGQVTRRMRQTLDVESVLRVAIDETRQALDLPEVIVRLRDPATGQSQQKADRAGNGRD
ncbi:MAG: GAF domain-containing protein [Anaerolineae bacterium]|jgi:GAF domain-containing protein